MKRAELVERLKLHKPWLEERGVSRLRLVGSFARDEAGADSDVDLLARFDPTPSLLQLAAIEIELSERIGRAVDLASESGLKPRVRERLEADAVDV